MKMVQVKLLNFYLYIINVQIAKELTGNVSFNVVTKARIFMYIIVLTNILLITGSY